MKHPEPALGSSQIKVLKALKAAMPNYVSLKDERAIDKLWKKGYVRWQSMKAAQTKEWAISDSGLKALERKEES